MQNMDFTLEKVTENRQQWIKRYPTEARSENQQNKDTIEIYEYSVTKNKPNRGIYKNRNFRISSAEEPKSPEQN